MTVTSEGLERQHRKSHCAQGHPFNEVNLYVRKNGKWMCRACKRVSAERARRVSGVRPLSDVSGRFWSRVLRTDTCWLWTAGKNNHGYGTFHWNSQVGYAHRWAFVDAGSVIEEGQEIDHLCRVPACVRPSHLEAVSHKENMRRGKYGQTTHCPSGHEYAGANLIIRRGERYCRECQRARDRVRYWATG